MDELHQWLTATLQSPATSDPLEYDAELLDLAVPSGEFGGPLASTGRVGVTHRIHGIGLYGQI